MGEQIGIATPRGMWVCKHHKTITRMSSTLVLPPMHARRRGHFWRSFVALSLFRWLVGSQSDESRSSPKRKISRPGSSYLGQAGQAKKILAENLGQVVQDVKFEFSRTEKSTLGQVAEAGKSKVLVQNNILLKITDSLCFNNRLFLRKYYFVLVL